MARQGLDAEPQAIGDWVGSGDGKGTKERVADAPVGLLVDAVGVEELQPDASSAAAVRIPIRIFTLVSQR
jgi:hypothetical protein